MKGDGGSQPDPGAERGVHAQVAVGKISQARHVRVELTQQGDEIALIVEDDGTGFDPGHVEKGVGLDSMRERLEKIGGQVEISSLKDQGTRLMAKMRRA